MKISVILPVYNVGEYIEACLESLLHQTVGQGNLEIIIVDDCSTDDTQQRAERYRDQFDHFIYYRYPENNGSPGKLRNKGVSLSHGEFIHFMDPDDILEHHAYALLLEHMQPEDDFVMGTMQSFNEDGSTFQHTTFKQHKLKKQYTSVSLAEVPFFAQVKIGVVLKLIRKTFYEKKQIQFTEDLRNGEDKIVDTLLYTRADAFNYIPEVIYHYRNRDVGENKSLTHQAVIDSIENDVTAYELCAPHYDAEALPFFKINALRSLLWKVLDPEFELLTENEQRQCMEGIHKVVSEYDVQVLDLYLNNEKPIVNLIHHKAYPLAIEYAALLRQRRESYYRGTYLVRKKKEQQQFKRSKSYQLSRIMQKLHLLK